MTKTGVRRLIGSALTVLVASATAAAVSAAPAAAAVTVAWQKIDYPPADEVWSFTPLADSTYTATTRSGGGPFCDPCNVTYQLWQKQSGQAWKDISPPGKEIVDSTTGTAADDVWAFKNDNGLMGYHWDGTAWTANSPDTARFSTKDSKALSRDDVWAAGTYKATTSQWVPAVAHFDGQGWNIAKLPDSMRTATLNTMSVNADDDIWVAGFKDKGTITGDAYQPFAAHWNGTQWTESALPSSSPDSTLLYAVAAKSPNDVWLGGNLYNLQGDIKGVKTGGYVLHWDGSTWKRIDVPGKDILWVSSFAYHDGRLWAGVVSNTSKGAARWTGTSWEFVNGPNGTLSKEGQLSASPDGSLYMNDYSTLARLAPQSLR
ncbi:hypothetical protein [Streptomyces misionensis]|uniref:hypothetical protein n=1 Tax=Streptomyces misionensis TaxID=67331 RepID=UPI0036B92AED